MQRKNQNQENIIGIKKDKTPPPLKPKNNQNKNSKTKKRKVRKSNVTNLDNKKEMDRPIEKFFHKKRASEQILESPTAQKK